MTSYKAPQSMIITRVMIMFILFLLFFPIVDAQGINTPQVSADTLQITYPKTLVLEEDLTFKIHAHVSNKSQLLTNSQASCLMHFYDDMNNHLLRNSTPSYEIRDFEWIVNGTNISNSGTYTAIIECNTSHQAGQVSYEYIVTPNGELAETSTAVFYIGLLGVLLFFLALSIYSFSEFDNLLNRVGMIGASYLLFIAITFIGWNMAQDFLTSSPFLIDMLRILFFVLVIGFFPMMIAGFIYYFLALWKIKEIQSMMEKGIPESEAYHRVVRRKR